MKKLLVIPIECGEQTCASEPGEFCAYLGAKKFGQAPWCMLFNVPLYDDREHPLGWVHRCVECLQRES